MAQDTLPLQGQRRLDHLPLEVLRQIAVRGPFTSTISLLQVNHSLRSACNDWTVFRDIIKNNGNHCTRKPTWRFTTLPFHSDPYTFWARYALADLKAAQFLEEPEKPLTRQISQWLPQITAMGHPMSSFLPIRQLLANIEGSKAGETAVLEFCRAAYSLSTQCDLDTDEDRAAFYASIVGYSYGQSDLTTRDLHLTTLPYVPLNDGWPRILDPSSSISDLLPLAYKAVSLIYHQLLQAIATRAIPRSGLPCFRTLDPDILPVAPTSLGIPFLTFMVLPLPFSPGCEDVFNTCHLKIMATNEFLESGTWAGYYGMELDRPFAELPWFDRPFNNVQFTVTPQSTPTSVIKFRSDGKFCDMMDSFHFEGQLSVDSGKIDLTKRYDTYGLHTPMQGVLTPFGIVASFGEKSRPGHWIWLWKTTWAANTFARQREVR